MIHNIRAFIRFATGYIQSTNNASFQGSLLKLHKETTLTTFAPKTYSNDEFIQKFDLSCNKTDAQRLALEIKQRWEKDQPIY